MVERIRSLLAQFPEDEAAVRELVARDASFNALCQEYREVIKLLDRFETEVKRLTQLRASTEVTRLTHLRASISAAIWAMRGASHASLATYPDEIVKIIEEASSAVADRY